MDKSPLVIRKTVNCSQFEVQLCNLDGDVGLLFKSDSLNVPLGLPPMESFSEYHNDGEGYSRHKGKNCNICDSTVETIYHVRSFKITCKNGNKYGESCGLRVLCKECILELFEIKNSLVEDEFYSILSAELV